MADDKRDLHLHDDGGVKALAPSINYGPALTALMVSVRERITVSSIRTLFSCIGVGESAPFNVPPQNQIAARMKTNANYFLTNYLLATAVVFFFLLYVLRKLNAMLLVLYAGLFFHRIQLLVCIIVACGWYLVLTKKTSELDHVVVYGKKIGEQEVLLFTTAFTIIFLIFFILPTIIFALSTTFVGSALHAFFRNNRLKDDSYSLPSHKASTASGESSEDLV
uniref:PRA1 family protein n=1 Tax=Globisporangium ultimum (strain ATCC 200006 / CBS 805.95 / DAOM BR144) TaxID=431595 RepID=K3WUT3_GLOUD